MGSFRLGLVTVFALLLFEPTLAGFSNSNNLKAHASDSNLAFLQTETSEPDPQLLQKRILMLFFSIVIAVIVVSLVFLDPRRSGIRTNSNGIINLSANPVLAQYFPSLIGENFWKYHIASNKLDDQTMSRSEFIDRLSGDSVSHDDASALFDHFWSVETPRAIRSRISKRYPHHEREIDQLFGDLEAYAVTSKLSFSSGSRLEEIGHAFLADHIAKDVSLVFPCPFDADTKVLYFASSDLPPVRGTITIDPTREQKGMCLIIVEDSVLSVPIDKLVENLSRRSVVVDWPLLQKDYTVPSQFSSMKDGVVCEDKPETLDSMVTVDFPKSSAESAPRPLTKQGSSASLTAPLPNQITDLAPKSSGLEVPPLPPIGLPPQTPRPSGSRAPEVSDSLCSTVMEFKINLPRYALSTKKQ